MHRAWLLVALLLVAAGSATVLAADSGIALSPSVEVRERTASLGSNEYPVTAVGVVDPGEAVTATVDVADRDYRVVVYDTHRRRYDARRGHGPGSVRLDTAGWGGGSYLVALEVAGNVEAVHPLVVNAYRVDVDAPDRIERDGRARVAVTATAFGDDVPVSEAVLFVGDGEVERSSALSRTASGEYAGSVSLSGLPQGEYGLAVVLRGSRAAFGEREILAVSPPRPLRVGGDATPAEAGDVSVAGPGTTAGDGPTGTDAAPGATGPVITPSPSTVEADAIVEPAGLTGGMLVPVVVLLVVVLVLLGIRWR